MLNIPDLDTRTTALIASFVSYVIYNIIFLAAQFWGAFATLFLGVYYILIFYGYLHKNKNVAILGTILQALATIVLFGLFVFFVVEIFTEHSLVYQKLVYIKNVGENQRVEVARNCSIVMAIDSFFTFGLHLWALYFCIMELKSQSDENSSETPIAAIAIHTELDYPQLLEIPRLRTTSYGEIIGISPRKELNDRHRSMPVPRRHPS